MARLIDADELLRDAEDCAPIRCGLADAYDVKWLVNAQITVDAVEVVHCGSCVSACDETADGWMWCNMWNNSTDCGGYCHKGRRKDNAVN